MPTHLNKIYRTLLPVIFLGVLAIACKRDDDELEPMRLFTPTTINSVAGETQVRLFWNASLYTTANDGVTYTVEVAADTLFSSPVVLSLVTDTSGVVFKDTQLDIKKKYFARIKANATATRPESKWITSNGFSIRGEQLFLVPASSEVRDRTAILRWRPSTGLSRIMLGAVNGTGTEIMLTEENIANNFIQLTGLTPSTKYVAEIFAGTQSKGTITFETIAPSIYTTLLNAGGDLAAAIEAASNGDLIGLEPGTYDLSAGRTFITGKTITIQSVSGNPADTKVNFKEITLKGSGAGVKLQGIDFDGGPGAADYFLNLTGLNADGEAATFSSITLENCIVRNTVNCFLRGNRGGNNAHKIDFIKLNNCLMYNNGDSYTYLTMDKMEFNRLDVTNSTFYNVGRAFIGWATNITGQPKPTVLIDQCTFNNFGSSARNQILFDANANPVDFTMQNSIIANTPKPGQSIGNNLLRAIGPGSVLEFKNNNYFKMTNGASPAVDLIIPEAFTQTNNKTIDLGWTATTSDFTLPTSSELRTAGTTGGAIGDPRWTR
ncbi:DUF4957 domain-containing protein [Pontibacter qinzhouensis]|uniref:DUF4957 domain-containing protein n=1 Tax=Pontibacter qinzhouensis TaxID=2603253 RepID=A0A5C8KDA8_9BACT|nr:DUF4957 domain-containing protein [Pontibacter qinzhouensis]TXK49132.1 DUF4957 domain-containing protein [Pontibacter qinzhouensis]